MIKELLIIEDEESSLQLIKQLTAQSGFAEKVTTFSNGVEGLAYFEWLHATEGSIAPELILLNLDLPLMDGWEFLDSFTQRYKNLFPNTIFCLLTESEDPQDRLRADNYTLVAELFSKPLTTFHLRFLQKFLATREKLYKGRKW